MKTLQGDMWDALSLRAYGRTDFADDLIMANPEHRKTVIFPAGVEIKTPEINTAQAASGLPPWKRRAAHG